MKWETPMKNDGVKTVLSTAHHQQIDGQSERKIQEVQTYFRIYMDFNQENWKKICPTAQYAMNNAEVQQQKKLQTSQYSESTEMKKETSKEG